MNKASILTFIISLFVGSGALAGATPEFKDYPKSRARMWISHSAISAATKSMSIALELDLDEDWHTYWENPGDSGAAPILDVSSKNGVLTPGQIFYPKPIRININPLTSFAYERRVIFLMDIDVADLSAKSDLAFKVEAEWLVCRVQCIPAFGTFDFKIPVDKESLQHQEIFQTARSEAIKNFVPNGSFEIQDNELVYKHSLVFDPTDIFVSQGQGLDNAEPKIQDASARFKIENKKPLSVFRGIAVGDDGEFFAFEASKTSQMPILLVIVFSFLGGLILNLMPCVLPVLSLKLFGLVNATQKGAQHVRLESVAYALGAILSFVLIAALLLVLRSFGQEIGWGFQLQSPVFVISMSLVFLLLSFNFLGLYEINIPFVNLGQKLTQKSGAKGSFFTGVLSVLVASPCTAPFMGAAMGVALSQGALFTLTSFTALGVGFAFPFLIFSVSPSLANLLPRPGEWMNTLKKLMFVPMFAASLWLGWISWQLVKPASHVEANSKSLEWTRFSSQALAKEIKTGKKAIFVNFTADWCLSCKVNDSLVFSDPKVKNFIKANNIVVFKADWTRRDSEITRELAKYDRASVPLYLFFEAGQHSPRILPELLTSSLFLELLSKE